MTTVVADESTLLLYCDTKGVASQESQDPRMMLTTPVPD